MAIVNGDGVILKFDAGSGLLLPFACARSITINMTSDIVGKSTIGSGDWKEKEVVALDWNFSIEGIVYLNTVGMITAPTFYQFWLNMVPVAIEYILTDEDGAEVIMSGNALITNVSTNGAVNNISSLNVSGEGTGELVAETPLIDGLIIDSDNVDIMDSDSVLITDLT